MFGVLLQVGSWIYLGYPNKNIYTAFSDRNVNMIFMLETCVDMF